MPLFDGIFRDLVTKKNMGTASVSFQPRQFGVRQATASEARVSVTFTTINVSTPVYHGLKHVPSQYSVISQNKAGRVYNDLPLQADSRTLVLKADTAMVAELIVR